MNKYLLTRITISFPVLIGITFVVFLSYNLAPGDALDAMIDPSVPTDQATLEQMRENLGLNQPLLVRYFVWLGAVAQGNLGYSLTNQRPVAERIGQRLPATLQLAGLALTIAIGLGVPLGMVAALKRNTSVDYLLSSIGLTFASIPIFFFALAAIYLFSLRLGWFPSFGSGDVDSPVPVLETLHHLILPALVLGLDRVGVFLRHTRSSMLEVINQDYLVVARAKGLTERHVLWRHAFRNGLLPVLTIVGLSMPFLVGGSAVVETIFAWPGIGQLAITAIAQRDYPVLMGVALIGSTVVLVSSIAIDLLYSIADPRVRYE